MDAGEKAGFLFHLQLCTLPDGEARRVGSWTRSGFLSLKHLAPAGRLAHPHGRLQCDQGGDVIWEVLYLTVILSFISSARAGASCFGDRLAHLGCMASSLSVVPDSSYCSLGCPPQHPLEVGNWSQDSVPAPEAA